MLQDSLLQDAAKFYEEGAVHQKFSQRQHLVQGEHTSERTSERTSARISGRTSEMVSRREIAEATKSNQRQENQREETDDWQMTCRLTSTDRS